MSSAKTPPQPVSSEPRPYADSWGALFQPPEPRAIQRLLVTSDAGPILVITGTPPPVRARTSPSMVTGQPRPIRTEPSTTAQAVEQRVAPTQELRPAAVMPQARIPLEELKDLLEAPESTDELEMDPLFERWSTMEPTEERGRSPVAVRQRDVFLPAGLLFVGIGVLLGAPLAAWSFVSPGADEASSRPVQVTVIETRDDAAVLEQVAPIPPRPPLVVPAPPAAQRLGGASGATPASTSGNSEQRSTSVPKDQVRRAAKRVSPAPRTQASTPVASKPASEMPGSEPAEPTVEGDRIVWAPWGTEPVDQASDP